jgi:hypothetical protein
VLILCIPPGAHPASYNSATCFCKLAIATSLYKSLQVCHCFHITSHPTPFIHTMDPQAQKYSNTQPNSTAWAMQLASEYGTAQIYPPNSNVHQSHLQVNPTPPFATSPDVAYDAETYPGHGLGNYIPDSILDTSSQLPLSTVGHHQLAHSIHWCTLHHLRTPANYSISYTKSIGPRKFDEPSE